MNFLQTKFSLCTFAVRGGRWCLYLRGGGGGGCSVVRGGEQSEVLRKQVLYIPSRRSHSFVSRNSSCLRSE